MFPDRKQAARWAAVLLVLVVAYLVTAKAARTRTDQLPPAQLPAFWGKVISPKNTTLGKDGMVIFRYTIFNDTEQTQHNLLVFFDRKVFGRQGWVIKELKTGAMVTKTIKVHWRKPEGTVQFCGEAKLAAFGLYWSSIGARPCYNRLT